MRKIFIILLACTVLLISGACTNDRNHSTGYANYGKEEEAREYLTEKIMRDAWGITPYGYEKPEVTYSSFELIDDGKWSAAGEVSITQRNYNASFNAWIIYNEELDSFSWSIELQDE